MRLKQFDFGSNVAAGGLLHFGGSCEMVGCQAISASWLFTPDGSCDFTGMPMHAEANQPQADGGWGISVMAGAGWTGAISVYVTFVGIADTGPVEPAG